MVGMPKKRNLHRETAHDLYILWGKDLLLNTLAAKATGKRALLRAKSCWSELTRTVIRQSERCDWQERWVGSLD